MITPKRTEELPHLLNIGDKVKGSLHTYRVIDISRTDYLGDSYSYLSYLVEYINESDHYMTTTIRVRAIDQNIEAGRWSIVTDD